MNTPRTSLAPVLQLDDYSIKTIFSLKRESSITVD